MAGNFNKKRRQFLKHATLTPLLVNPSTSHAFFPLLARGLMMAFDFFVANAERRTVYEAVASTLARPAIVATVERAVISSTALTFAQRKTALQMIKAACAAWIRKSGNSEELVFVTDSRLRSFGSWDCNPKIYTFSRSDFVMCFSGDTIFSYPMMIQLKNEIELNPKIKSNAVRRNSQRNAVRRNRRAVTR